MKTLFTLVIGFGLLATSIHSQDTAVINSGAILIQIKAANAALIERQATTIKLLQTMEAEAQQLRIVSKRG